MTEAAATSNESAGRGNIPRVSVILPVYNGGRYLAAAVDSILAQTFRDFELIAVDDGSTDETLALLEQWARGDGRMLCVRQDHAGLIAALNRGLTLARGEFIARMDHDDISQPDRFARQVEFLDAHLDVAVVGSAVTLIDERGHAIRDVRYPETPAAIAEFLRAGSALAHPAVMMRRAAVIAVGGYRPAYQHAEDYDLWLRMAEEYALANLPDRLLLYRQRRDKLSIASALEQRLAAIIARFAARCRRAGQPDPTEGLTTLSRQDIDRFDLSPEERAAIPLELADALLAADTNLDAPGAFDKAVELLGEVDAARVPGSPLVRTMLAVGYGFARRHRPLLAAKWLWRAATCHSAALADVCAIVFDRATRRLAW